MELVLWKRFHASLTSLHSTVLALPLSPEHKGSYFYVKKLPWVPSATFVFSVFSSKCCWLSVLSKKTNKMVKDYNCPTNQPTGRWSGDQLNAVSVTRRPGWTPDLFSDSHVNKRWSNSFFQMADALITWEFTGYKRPFILLIWCVTYALYDVKIDSFRNRLALFTQTPEVVSWLTWFIYIFLQDWSVMVDVNLWCISK